MPWIATADARSSSGILPDWFLAHWTKLALTTRQADPFCASPIWNLAYHHVINRGRPVFYAASDRGALVFSETATMYGEPVLAPLEDSWLYGQPLLGEEAPDLLAEALPRIRERYDSSPLFLLSGIIDPSPFASRLYYRFSPAYCFYRHARMRQCSASLAGGVDGWLSRRSANCRAKLRKAARKASQLGAVFERCRPDPANAGKVYRRMLKIEEKSWKGIGNCGMTESPSAEFYDEMLRLLAKSRSALVIFASVDGEDAGFIFGALFGTFYRGQQFSYGQAYAPLSLGNIMQLEKIRWLCELGCARYDMGPAMGEKMQYKKHWTEESQDFQAWIMRKAD